MVRVLRRSSGWMYSPSTSEPTRTCVNPSQPRRMPTTVWPLTVDRYTRLLMTELSPGTSPPPVRMPTRTGPSCPMDLPLPREEPRHERLEDAVRRAPELVRPESHEADSQRRRPERARPQLLALQDLTREVAHGHRQHLGDLPLLKAPHRRLDEKPREEGRDKEPGRHEHLGQRLDHLHRRAGQADLFLGLPQRGVTKARVGL